MVGAAATYEEIGRRRSGSGVYSWAVRTAARLKGRATVVLNGRNDGASVCGACGGVWCVSCGVATLSACLLAGSMGCNDAGEGSDAGGGGDAIWFVGWLVDLFLC